MIVQSSHPRPEPVFIRDAILMPRKRGVKTKKTIHGTMMSVMLLSKGRLSPAMMTMVFLNTYKFFERVLARVPRGHVRGR